MTFIFFRYLFQSDALTNHLLNGAGRRSVPSLKPTLIAIWLPFAAGIGALRRYREHTPAAQGPELEEIVVTGMRASLEKSLDIKKNATVVLDSINSDELGRFPDADVADSLEHLPGITISRTTGGEGQKVSVRGFGPQYNIVTLNNRILATDDDAPRPGVRRAALGSDFGRRRAQVLGSLGARGQHRRHGEPAHREPVRQPGIPWRRACRGQLQRHVHAARPQFSAFVSEHVARPDAGLPARGRALRQ